MDILEKKQLNNSCNKFYKSLFFYKSCYYFLNNNYSLNVYNCYLDDLCEKKICENYNGIVKPLHDNKFYAFNNNNNFIYILNENFVEINKIEIKAPKEYLKPIKSIAVDIKKYKIIICTENNLYSINFDGDFIKNELSLSAYNKISSSSKEEKNYRNLNGCCCKKEYIASKIKIDAIGYFCNKLYIAYNKENSIFLAELSENGNIISELYLDDNISILSIVEVNNNLQILGSKYNTYNFLYITNECCRHHEKINNYCCICKCEDSGCNHDCSNKKCENVIESIALIECSIAHILNAEGEKIQKALCLTNDVCELIKINESVSKTISYVTMLEQILTEKLENALKNCNHKSCDDSLNSCCDKKDH